MKDTGKSRLRRTAHQEQEHDETTPLLLSKAKVRLQMKNHAMIPLLVDKGRIRSGIKAKLVEQP